MQTVTEKLITKLSLIAFVIICLSNISIAQDKFDNVEIEFLDGTKRNGYILRNTYTDLFDKVKFYSKIDSKPIQLIPEEIAALEINNKQRFETHTIFHDSSDRQKLLLVSNTGQLNLLSTYTNKTSRIFIRKNGEDLLTELIQEKSINSTKHIFRISLLKLFNSPSKYDARINKISLSVGGISKLIHDYNEAYEGSRTYDNFREYSFGLYGNLDYFIISNHGRSQIATLNRELIGGGLAIRLKNNVRYKGISFNAGVRYYQGKYTVPSKVPATVPGLDVNFKSILFPVFFRVSKPISIFEIYINSGIGFGFRDNETSNSVKASSFQIKSNESFSKFVLEAGISIKPSKYFAIGLAHEIYGLSARGEFFF